MERVIRHEGRQVGEVQKSLPPDAYGRCWEVRIYCGNSRELLTNPEKGGSRFAHPSDAAKVVARHIEVLRSIQEHLEKPVTE